ncbi:MAG: 1-deoxy-D-xylulose-5-phosphate reductoisomerase [Dehalococcoidia bacterium]|nr:1-deoxy-D-xylulose-5-phosphate reductoisomerase [Dehalococcoidia bacterium]
MEPTIKKVVILGSTGSVGTQTLEIIRAFSDRFEIVGLCNGYNTPLFKQQLDEFKPRYFNTLGEVESGYAGSKFVPAEEIASLPEVDLVVAATVGCAGMPPAIAALQAGKSLGLANKEVIVMAGEKIMEVARTSGSEILPIDSEPSAIWQCLEGEVSDPARLIITASGGAFRDRTWDSLGDVTLEQALNHPTWTMGPKITVDAATLMNKAFEVIESRWLFDIPFDQIDVTIHRQSIVHSMVEFADGTLKAQLGPTSMLQPIQHALFHPERQGNNNLPRLNAVTMGSLTFEEMDRSLYPCFELALDYGKRGGTFPAALAGADEAAVQLFLNKKIKFTQIPDIVAETLVTHEPIFKPSVADTIEAAQWATETTLARHNQSTILS